MLREAGQYARMLEDAGFARVAVLPGPFEIIVATKP
jgi:hypothetical protein